KMWVTVMSGRGQRSNGIVSGSPHPQIVAETIPLPVLALRANDSRIAIRCESQSVKFGEAETLIQGDAGLDRRTSGPSHRGTGERSQNHQKQPLETSRRGRSAAIHRV